MTVRIAEVDAARQRIRLSLLDTGRPVDGADVSDLAVSLTCGGTPLVTVRRPEDGTAEEVVNGAGLTVRGAVSSWTLIGRKLTFEYGRRAGPALGFPKIHELRLDVADDDIRRMRDTLIDVLNGTCCVVDSLGLRHAE